MNNSLIGDMARAYALPGLKRAAGLAVRMVPVPQPTLLVGAGSSVRLGQAIAAFAHEKILLVTDAVVLRLGLAKGLMDALKAGGTDFVVFDEITPDAPIAIVEKGIAKYQHEGCDAIIAFGGGSVIDAAKAIGQSVANQRHPRDLVGYFRGWKGPPPTYAVPTTAGTGSEVTVAAVISDPENHKKLVIADSRLVPRLAALDPVLMIGLPRPITAATGMDALTHAVEAYLGNWGTEFTDSMALAAVSMIYQNLPLAYVDGKNLAAREQMALASAYAGMAFTRANVGNVHAIAHQLGGRYHTPHGLANAILLPAVLRFSSAAVEPKLAILAQRAGLARKGDTESRLAQRFLDSVEAMNRKLGIPKTLEALREQDISALATAACWEADTNYPVPRAMSQSDCEALLRELLPPVAPKRGRSAKPSAAPAGAAVRKEAARR
jgi:alcohol dehydrogenase class IV